MPHFLVFLTADPSERWGLDGRNAYEVEGMRHKQHNVQRTCLEELGAGDLELEGLEVGDLELVGLGDLEQVRREAHNQLGNLERVHRAAHTQLDLRAGDLEGVLQVVHNQHMDKRRTGLVVLVVHTWRNEKHDDRNGCFHAAEARRTSLVLKIEEE